MVTIYYEDRATGLLRPERRTRTTPFAGTDRRKDSVPTLTSEQYRFLRGCLLRREAVRERLSRSVRRLRHLLVAMSAVFIALFFSASGTAIYVSVGSVNAQIPLQSIAAVAPFVIAYLIVYICDQERTKMRLGHECDVLDVALRRFGGETSRSVLGRFRNECRKDKGLWDQLIAPKLNYALYAIRDGFLVMTVVVALGWAVWIAGGTYVRQYSQEPHVSIAFLSYLAVSAIAAVASPLLYRGLERKKSRALAAYLESIVPVQEKSAHAAREA